MDEIKKGQRNIRFYILGVLLAVELLMSFSFLGYVHVSPSPSPSPMCRCCWRGRLLGPAESTAVGAAFGLASMWKAGGGLCILLRPPVLPPERLPLRQHHAQRGRAYALRPRGWGSLYAAARKPKRAGIWICLVSYFGSVVNSFFVYSALWLFFPETGNTPLNCLSSLTRADNIASSLACVAVVYVCWRINRSRQWRMFEERFVKARSLGQSERYHTLSLVVIIIATICMAAAVGIYFVNRMQFALEQSGLVLSDANYADLLHLQVQFLIGILSLMSLVIIFLIFNRRYATYMNYEARTDPLTGAMTRRAFFQACKRLMAGLQPARTEGHGIFHHARLGQLQVRQRRTRPPGGRPHPQRDDGRAARRVQPRRRRAHGRRRIRPLPIPPVSREELEAALRLLQERVHHIRLRAGA